MNILREALKFLAFIFPVEKANYDQMVKKAGYYWQML
jgi:hypothetical protein